MPGDLFAALADPTRRRLIEILADGEHAVNDLVEQVDIHQPGVSRHLKILHEAGFVDVRPQGQRRLYCLRKEPFAEVERWAQRYAHEQRARLTRLARLVEAPDDPGSEP